MHFVDAAEEIVQVAHDVLVSAHQEEAEIVRLDGAVAILAIERVQRQGVAHVAQINELVDLAVRVARDVHERRLARRSLGEAAEGHDGKQMAERPVINQ